MATRQQIRRSSAYRNAIIARPSAKVSTPLRAPVRPTKAPARSIAKPPRVIPQLKSGHRMSVSIPSASNGLRARNINRNNPTTPMGNRKGVMTSLKRAGAIAGAVGGGYGKVAGFVTQLLPDGSTTMHRRVRHKGLTYNEIRGANRVLKLVKKFAPAGHKTALKITRRRA